MGHFVPQTRLDNNFFSELDIAADSQWIADRTGIQTRYSVLDRTDIHLLRQGTTDYIRLMHAGKVMSIAAMANQTWAVMRERLPRTGGPPRLDLLISGTSIPDWGAPANACMIARELGVNCTAFDVNAACSSFVVGVHVLRSMLMSGSGRCGAVFTCERLSMCLNYAEYSNCVLLGDGAAGAVFEVAPSTPQGLELLDTIIASDPSGANLVTIPVGGMFAQHGRAVQKFAITKTVEITEALLQRNGLTARDIRYFISHQANLRMLTSVVSRLGLHPEQHLYNVDSHGNRGAAGAPMVMSMHWDRFAPGDLIVMAVVGAGLTWGAALFRCLYSAGGGKQISPGWMIRMDSTGVASPLSRILLDPDLQRMSSPVVRALFALSYLCKSSRYVWSSQTTPRRKWTSSHTSMAPSSSQCARTSTCFVR